MTVEDACLKSHENKPEEANKNKWYQLCNDTLQEWTPTGQVHFFVFMASTRVELRYNATMRSIDDQMLLQSAAAPPLEHCKERYGEARDLVNKIMRQLPGCEFTAVKQEYHDVHLAVQACQSELRSSGYRSSPLYAAVSADLDLTMVAVQLGALLDAVVVS